MTGKGAVTPITLTSSQYLLIRFNNSRCLDSYVRIGFFLSVRIQNYTERKQTIVRRRSIRQQR